MDAPIPEVDYTPAVNYEAIDAYNAAVQSYDQEADIFMQRAGLLGEKVKEVEDFYSNLSKKQANASKGSSSAKDREKGRHGPGLKNQGQDAEPREPDSTKRMQDLMRQFGTILEQIAQHKWATPFLEPVDVVGLDLQDYYEVIEKPMDFRTIRNRMEANDGSGYMNVREICADVRLVFKNAIKYNGEKHDISVMAATLLDKFEDKWLQLLPKVTEEEKRLEEEEGQAQLELELAQEAAHAQIARDISNELCKVESELDELREKVIQQCRKMTSEEKRKLGMALSKLSSDDLAKALEIIAQNNPNFQVLSEEVELDMDVQNEPTLWKLKVFLSEVMEAQGKSPASIGGRNPISISSAVAANDATIDTNNNKRKREICEAIAKTAKKKCKRASP